MNHAIIGGRRRTFVLIHGAWSGGWIWERVATRIAARGHRVLTPSLTGLADRSHLLTPDITLSTHVADVANLIAWEQLEDIVLVGHSYAGMVIAAVAEQVAAGVIGSIMFLDAVVPEDGRALADYAPVPAALIEVRGGTKIVSPPRIAAPRVSEPDAAWMNDLRTPQPLATFTEPIRLSGALDDIASRTFLFATGESHAWLSPFAIRARQADGWRYEELPCGHDVMVAMPDRCAEAILAAAD